MLTYLKQKNDKKSINFKIITIFAPCTIVVHGGAVTI